MGRQLVFDRTAGYFREIDPGDSAEQRHAREILAEIEAAGSEYKAPSRMNLGVTWPTDPSTRIETSMDPPP